MADTFDYQLQCQALHDQVPAQTIKVTNWQGTEAVSRPYRFEITFAASDANLAMEKLLNQPAALHAYRPDGSPIRWQGIVTQGVQLGCDEVYDYYQIVLEPRLARLRHFKWSDIYLNQQLDDLIRQLLRLAGMNEPYSSASAPYDYRIAASQLTVTRTAFTCQFDETCLDFLMRKLEFYGVYFWFEQGTGQESVVFANQCDQQPADLDAVVYYPKGVIDPSVQEIAVTQLNRRFSLQPDTVALHDSNDLLNTAMTLVSQTNVPSPVSGLGETHLSDDHFQQLGDGSGVGGNTLSTWRSEELACQRLRVEGQARTPGIVAGRMIAVSEYLRGTNAAQYYVTEIHHEGRQTIETAPETDEPMYLARFAALPRWSTADNNGQPLQFRPARITPVPMVSQLVNGFIDIETPNQPKQFAQTDDNGCYQVRLCFPRQRYAGNKNSAALRLATPYAAGSPMPDITNAGMHFPLREGTEVLIAFLNGNPDRPIIVAALPNTESPSVVTAANADQHVISTPAGNMIAMGDGSGDYQDPGRNVDSYVHLYSSTDSSALNLGNYAASGLPTGFSLTTKANGSITAAQSMTVSVPGNLQITAGTAARENYHGSSVPHLPSGTAVNTSDGMVIEHYLGNRISSTKAVDMSHFFGAKVDVSEDLKFHYNAKKTIDIAAVSAKEINLQKKKTYTDEGTYVGSKLKWIAEDWSEIALKKTEMALDIDVTAGLHYRLVTMMGYGVHVGSKFTAPSIYASYGVVNLTSSNVTIAGAVTTNIVAGVVDVSAEETLTLSAADAAMIDAGGAVVIAAGGEIAVTAASISMLGDLVEIG